MNRIISQFINSVAGRLMFSLFSGLGYFMLVARFIIEMSRGMWIMLLFLAPLIICGSALVIVKYIKQAQECDNSSGILKIFWTHIAVIIIGMVFAIDLFLN